MGQNICRESNKKGIQDPQEKFRRVDRFKFEENCELVLEHYVSFRDQFEGLKLWEGAIVMTRYLLRHQGVIEGKDVCDLGCGMGVLGLALAKAIPCRIRMSDYLEEVLGLARLNLNRNLPLTGEVEIEKLDWNNPGDYSHKFDLIIGCELVYSITNSESLCELLKNTLKPDGVIMMMIPTCRSYGPEFLEKLNQIGNFEIEETILKKEVYREDPMIGSEDLFYPLRELEFRLLIVRSKKE